ncbi:MAG: hypothetical protein JWP21_180 [Tardiphaga sp.]|jgi:hypothetical protein|nr:hypothetical protein [Tardiphaga sp.]
MSDDQLTLIVRQQHSPVHGWVIVAREASGVQRQLVGVFASRAAAERWIKANPNLEPKDKIID